MPPYRFQSAPVGRGPFTRRRAAAARLVGQELDHGPCADTRPVRVVRVRAFGWNGWPQAWCLPKRTVAYGWSVLHAAAAASPQYRWVLDIGKGTFDLPNQILTSTLSYFTVRGKGHELTRLRGSGDGHWQIWIHDSTGFRLEDLHLDVDTEALDASGVTLLSVTCADITRVRFQPIRFWGLRIGDAPDCTAIPPSSHVRVSACVFADHRSDSTQESLLALGVSDLLVRDCTFENIDGGSIGLGLWQQVTRARVWRCSFGGTGTGSVFGSASRNLEYTSCQFAIRNGVRGGVQSDCEAVGATRAADVRIEACDFRSPASTNPAEGNGVQLFAADLVRVAGCTFEAYFANPLVIGGRTTTNPIWDGGDVGVDVDQPAPHEVVVEQCTFACTQSGDYWRIHPDILVEHVHDDLALTVRACVFRARSAPNEPLLWQAMTVVLPESTTAEDAAAAFALLNITFVGDNLVEGPVDASYATVAVSFNGGEGYTVLSERPRDAEHVCV